MLRLVRIFHIFALHMLFYRFCAALRDKTFGERLRAALERLGPVFIKLGQFLATRDFFEEATQEQLRKLWDGRTPLPFEMIRPIIENAVGAQIEACFDSFESKAFASASIAQVHVAVCNGRKAAVKVLRPGAIEIIRRDVRIARQLIWVGRLFSGRIRYLDSLGALNTVESWLAQEVDFRIEAKNAEIFRECYKNVRKMVIPEIWFDSQEVLVMEFLEGIPCSKWSEKYRSLGYDPQASVRTWIVHTFGWAFKRIVVPIHGDPHPANAIIMVDGAIGLIDFGVAGRISERELRLFTDAVFAVYAQNAKRTVDALLELGGGQLDDRNMYDFERDVARYVKVCRTKPFDWWLIELGNMLVKYRIPMPETFTLICRFGILANKIAQTFFPGSSTIDLVGEEIKDGMRQQFVDRARHIRENLDSDLSLIAYELMLQVEEAPQKVAAFVRDPLGVVSEILETLSAPTQKKAA